IGSDTGGSIRIPGSLCGVAGFKPAFGSIDIAGVIPLSKSLDTLGPIAPDINTTAAAYAAMSGEAVSLDKLTQPRLAVPRGWVSELDPPTAAAWKVVSGRLPELDFLDRDRLFQVGLTILLYEAASYHRHWATECPEKYGEDVLRLIRRGLEIPAAEFDQALAERSQLEQEAHKAMEGFDAFVLPATAIMARGEARGRQRVLDLVDARPGMRVLDLACGPGNLAWRLAALVAPDGEVVGVDLAPGMIELARRRSVRNARFEVMDIEQLAF